MSQFPTIESFFQPLSVNGQKENGTATPPKVGDGFTEEEVQSALNPTNITWKPQESYDEVGIGDLSPGPRRAAITGRVVNLYEAATPSKMPTAATGYLKLIIKDDTGVIMVLRKAQHSGLS
jgi:ssDNA-binding replication factor A large subunit